MALAQQPVALTGGLNLQMDPLAVSDAQLIYSKNLFPRTPGLASVRWAMRHMEYITPDPSYNEYNFNSVRDFWFTNNATSGLVIAVAGGNDQGQGTHYGNLYDYPDVGVRLILFNDITDINTAVAMDTLGTIADRPFVFDLNDYIIALDGATKGRYYTRGAPLAWTPITWTGEFGDGFKPKLAVANYSNNRTVYAQDNFIVWSDSFQPFVVGVNWPLGETNPITAIDRVSANGVSQAQTDLLLVRTLYSAYLISGQPDETSATDGAAPSMAKLPVAAGCISQATSVNTPYGQIWCGPDDVWILAGGSIPQRIGTTIRPAIQRLASGYEWTAHACYADGIYRLCLPSPGQEQGPDEPLEEQYWLDLRNMTGEGGAVWYGPQVPIPQGVWDGGRQGTSCMKLDTRIGNQGLACSAVALRSLAAADISMATWPTAIALVAFDGDEPVDSAYPRYPASPEARLPSTAYEVGDVVAWNDFLWRCLFAGTTDSTPTATVFQGPGIGGSWELTGTTIGYSIVDGTVTWTAVMVVPDGVDGSNFPVKSPCPAFLSNMRANDSLVLFELKTKEYAGQDVQLDKRIDSMDLTYAAGNSFGVAYQFFPNFRGYTFPGSESILVGPDSLLQADSQHLPVVADVRRMAKAHLPSDPLIRNSAQHFQARLQNLGDVIFDYPLSQFYALVWAKSGDDNYLRGLESAMVLGRGDILDNLTVIQAAVSSFLGTLTVAEITNGDNPSTDLVMGHTWSPVDVSRPRFSIDLTLTPGSPFDNVWLLFNDYGPLNPNGSDPFEFLTGPERVRRSRMAALLGGVISLDSLGGGLGPSGVGNDQTIAAPSTIWSCQPTVPVIPALNLFVKTYGRRDKTGVVSLPSTS
jgi:hypothetical protein